MHRAITSLMEELEAIDWYDQRIDATGDAELAAVLAHNRDEEKEHACMVLEWIRRHDPYFDVCLRRFLFTSGRIEEIEEAHEGAGSGREGGADRDAVRRQPARGGGAMIGLNRDLAPMSGVVWERVEREARDVLRLQLAARRILDFEGPLGWDHSAVDLGRVEPLDRPRELARAVPAPRGPPARGAARTVRARTPRARADRARRHDRRSRSAARCGARVRRRGRQRAIRRDCPTRASRD